MTLAEQLFEAERTILILALHANQGARLTTAEHLGISPATLTRKMIRHRLNFPTEPVWRKDRQRFSRWQFGRLTPRQREVMNGMVAGKTTGHIASDLGVTDKTVEYHRAILYKRLQVNDVASLTRMAIAEGAVTVKTRSAGLGVRGRLDMPRTGPGGH